jgi:hypothetical protein
VGQAFALGGSGWSIEPQLQLIHQHMDLNNSVIAGAVVQPQADSGWIARAGVRVKGQLDTGMGTLQPYGRFNVYKTSSGADIARFVNGATTTDIAAPTGGTSTELAGGFTLALSPVDQPLRRARQAVGLGRQRQGEELDQRLAGRAGEVVSCTSSAMKSGIGKVETSVAFGDAALRPSARHRRTTFAFRLYSLAIAAAEASGCRSLRCGTGA